MAHAATLGALTGELIEAVTGLPSKTRSRRYKALYDATLATIKSQAYLRTNQFEVQHALDGLEERFRVNNRDGLADEFRDSLDRLEEHATKWHPEILALLLGLSDQPTFKTKLSDLDAVRLREEQKRETFSWEDVAREDGWDEDELLWQSIDYAQESGDESFEDEPDETPKEMPLLYANDVDPNLHKKGRTAADYIIQPEDTELLKALQSTQQWRIEVPQKDDIGLVQKIIISETQVVREVLSMLQGLNTTLFNEATGLPEPNFHMQNIAWETYKAVIRNIADSGRRILLLWRFVSHPQVIPHLQAFQDCITKRLRDFDTKLSQIEARFAAPTGEVMFTLLSVIGEITPWLQPLLILSDIIAQIQDSSRSDTFRYLELLYDETTLAQLRDDMATYEFLARIFLECFQVYIRPIRHWMDEGRISSENEIFFIVERPIKVPMSHIWQDRFNLRQNAEGTLHAPKFLKPSAHRIYNAGKNIVVLRLLGKYELGSSSTVEEPSLDFEHVCPEGLGLATFPDLFGAAFNRWIQSKYRKTSTTLKDVLFDMCELSSGLDALQALYLMSDGFATASFADHLFDKLENLNPVWYDRFALVGTAQDAFAPLLDTSGLSLRRAIHVLHKPRILDNFPTDNEYWDERALFYTARSNLLWFCTTLQSYLATLVLEPNERGMRRDLLMAEDVDSMISVHAACLEQMIEQACLGSKLAPIRERILDILDLAIKLELAREGKAAMDGSEPSHLFRREHESKEGATREDGLTTDDYIQVLEEITADFAKHLSFICSELKSAARASSDTQSAKWDILADMLHQQSPNSESVIISTAMDDVDERSRLLPQQIDEDSGDAPAATSSRPEISAAFPRRSLIHCILIFILSFLFLSSFFFQLTPLLKALTRNICHRVRPDLDPDSPECYFGEGVKPELVLFTRLNYVFNSLPGILSALPYGYLADQYGRKRGLYLALVGSALAQLSCIIIYFWPDVFHYRLALISPFFMFIGGGTLVFASLLFTMLSDIAPDAHRTSTFFGMSASMLAAGQLVSPLTSRLMLKSIWLPVFVGISLYIPIIAIALYLPETLHLKALPDAAAPDSADTALDNQEERDIDIDNHERPSWIHRWRSFTEGVYRFRAAALSIFWGNRQVTLLLLTMLLAHLGEGAQSSLLLYVYGRFGWNPLKVSPTPPL
ncbi:Spc98 family domain-containing protein [Trichoderma evansii]